MTLIYVDILKYESFISCVELVIEAFEIFQLVL